MDTLGHPVAHEHHPIAATASIAMLALLVVVLDFAVGIPVLGLSGTLYANIAGLLVTVLLAIVYSRQSHA